MGKITIMVLLLVSFGLVFAGTVSAESPYVEVTVLDDDDSPVTTVAPDDNVNVGAYVNAGDTGLTQPYVEIEVDPEDGLDLDEANAKMTTDGTTWIKNADPTTFFFWYEPDQVWVWDIHTVTGNMALDKSTELSVPSIVTATGEITVFTDLYEHGTQEDVWVTDDSYTFRSVAPASTPTSTSTSTSTSQKGISPVDATTVPLQNTGTPITAAIIGIVIVIGGTICSRLE